MTQSNEGEPEIVDQMQVEVLPGVSLIPPTRFERDIIPAPMLTSIEFVPSRDDMGVDAIVVPTKTGMAYSVAPRPGMPLVMPTDEQRQAADSEILIDQERTEFLSGVVRLVTQPYSDMFRAMVPTQLEKSMWTGIKIGERAVARTDHHDYDDIELDIETKLTYLTGPGGNDLKVVQLQYGNNVENYSPILSLQISSGLVTKVALSFDSRRHRALDILAGKSKLGALLAKGFKDDAEATYSHASSVVFELGSSLAFRNVMEQRAGHYDSFEGVFRNYQWEPRQKKFKNFKESGTHNTVSPTEFIELLRETLALIPTVEQGTVDLRRVKDLNLKSLSEILDEVQDSDIPSEDQLGAVVRLLSESDRASLLRAGYKVRV